jgi:flap endonuclease-1
MGVQNLGDLMVKRKVGMEELSRRVLTIDALNYLYAFLSVIRQPDGTPLMDQKMRVTSHLSGLFYRTVNLMESDIRLVFVFDGEAPSLKKDTIKERQKQREAAKQKWQEALTAGDMSSARKYAQFALFMTNEMIQESKNLLDSMGVSWIQAPSEGEAQAAYMTKKGDSWGTGSQDYDSILFGSPRLIRNIVISGRRKLPSRNVYVRVEPEIVDAAESFRSFGVTREQLIEIAIVLGTDYNPGTKGIGPKTALKLVKKSGNAEIALKEKGIVPTVSVSEVRELFVNPKITQNYEIKSKPLDKEKVTRLLVDDHGFSLERVQVALKRIEDLTKSAKPTGLDQWL